MATMKIFEIIPDRFIVVRFCSSTDLFTKENYCDYGESDENLYHEF
jgi:hypothetical protein